MTVAESIVDLITDFPKLIALNVVDAEPFIRLLLNGLTVPNVSFKKFTTIPSGTCPNNGSW